MANWKYQTSIKTIHDTYQDTLDLEQLKTAMAAKVRQLATKTISIADRDYFSDSEILETLAQNFEIVKDIDEYDEVLSELYDWGDAGHKCWIGSF